MGSNNMMPIPCDRHQSLNQSGIGNVPPDSNAMSRPAKRLLSSISISRICLNQSSINSSNKLESAKFRWGNGGAAKTGRSVLFGSRNKTPPIPPCERPAPQDIGFSPLDASLECRPLLGLVILDPIAGKKSLLERPGNLER